jgi:UDP-N-acetylmuramyl pentapeptide synthase
MLELGEQAESAHRDLARWIHQRQGIDAIAFVGEFSDVMADSLQGQRKACDIRAFDSLDNVVEWLKESESAHVFLKGSRGNRLERVVEMLEVQPVG